MKQSSILILLTLIVVSCGVPSGRFRLEGRFRHLNQGEFYVYAPYAINSKLDTIKVADGRFAYECDMVVPTTLVMLFPNFSEQPVFAAPGTKVTISGDASHLREMEIKGGNDNKLMSEFRQATASMSHQQIVGQIEQFVANNPKSPVSAYLIRRYLIEHPEADYAKASSLLKRMAPADNDNQWSPADAKTMAQLAKSVVGATIPDIVKSPYAKVTVVYTWATWSNESLDMQRALGKLYRKNPNNVTLVGICLDGDKKVYKRRVDADSIKWRTICDGMMWSSPELQRTGLMSVSQAIVADSKGKIVLRSSDASEIEKRVSSLLK